MTDINLELFWKIVDEKLKMVSDNQRVIIEKLDRIEKRLDVIEPRTTGTKLVQSESRENKPLKLDKRTRNLKSVV